MSNIVFTGTVAGTFTVDPDGTARIVFGESVPVPPPPPPPLPPDQPPSGCGPNEIFGPNDIDAPPEGGLFPGQRIKASGPLGCAIRFVYNPAFAQIGLFDQSAKQYPKDFVISECPHSFVPVTAPNNSNQLAHIENVSMQASLKLSATPGFFVCMLVPGKTYYLNFRSSLPNSINEVESQILLN